MNLDVFGGGDLGQRARSCWGQRHVAPGQGHLPEGRFASAQSRHPSVPRHGWLPRPDRLPHPEPSLTYNDPAPRHVPSRSAAGPDGGIMTDTASGAATATDKTPLTGYVVLAEQAKPSPNTASSMPTGGWEIVAKDITARNAAEAVRKYAEKKSDGNTEPRVLVAIAARSWKPLRVTPKVTTSLDIEEAS